MSTKNKNMDQDKPSTSFKSKPRKRTHSKIELQVEDDKTQQHNHDVPIQNKKTNKHQTTKTILDFPDEVLLCILKNVDRNDLKNLRLCCRRFSRLAADKSLWNLDYGKEPILPSEMEPYETFLQPLTHTLAICGDFQQDSESLLEHLFFFKVKQICRILHTLKIENYLINVDEVTPEMSTTIQKLEIKNCIACTSFRLLTYTYHFFRGICWFVPHVKHLIFNNVLWILRSTFVTNISNLTELQKLKIISCFCLRIFNSDIDVFPFTCTCQKVKILDLRNSAIEEKLVEWFCQIKSLEELYLDCPKYLRNEWSSESLKELRNFYYEENISLHEFDELYNFLNTIEPLLAENRVEEIISYKNKVFQIYLLSNISRYISRCNNLKKLHIRYYSDVTRTDINMALTLPNLIELDITGCSVTLEDVKQFESQKPNVQIYSSFSKPHKKYETMNR